MEISSEGLRVLVTGGAKGIGLAIAKAFAANGARVHICDIDGRALELRERDCPDMTMSLTDITELASIDALFADIDAKLGGLDVLVNNAAITGPAGPVEDNDPDEWAKTLQVNVVGQFHCVHRAVPRLKAAGGGSIVNMSSISGRLGYPLRTAYSTSKWALVGFTKGLAMELGPHNIRVNAIMPGIVSGERQTRVQLAKARELGISDEEMESRYLAPISLRRKVSEDEIASMALYLCANAGRSISGQSLSVCGNAETLRR